jgi:hypothetical protein
MSEPINLREIFESQIRNYLHAYLVVGPLKGWNYQLVLQFVDEAIKANKGNIDSYVYAQNVTLLNMKEHVKAIVDKFLIPYLDKKRVK